MLKSEDEIERSVERKTDNIDRWFMSGKLTQEQYDRAIAEISKWAEREYRTARKEVQQ